MEWYVYLFTFAALAIVYKLWTTVFRIDWKSAGKVVVITGASSGIGKEMALQLASQGACLVLAARRKDELEAVAEECKKEGAKAISVVTDVSQQDQCKALIEAAVKEFGTVDCLVLNAGISMGSFFEDVEDLSIYNRIMDVNYYQCVYLTHAALPHLIKSKGRIVVVSSLAGKVGPPGRTGYSASKFAVHGFFAALRNEVGVKHGITITVACPGPVQTDINSTRLVGHKGAPIREIDMATAQPVEDAVAIILSGVKKGDREVLFTGSVPPFIFNLVLALAPGLLDKAVLMQWEKVTKQAK